jgi:hypothetical protein
MRCPIHGVAYDREREVVPRVRQGRPAPKGGCDRHRRAEATASRALRESASGAGAVTMSPGDTLSSAPLESPERELKNAGGICAA